MFLWCSEEQSWAFHVSKAFISKNIKFQAKTSSAAVLCDMLAISADQFAGFCLSTHFLRKNQVMLLFIIHVAKS